MERILSIAEKIQTPLSLSAFIIIILFLLYRQLFDKLPIENVVSSDTYKIIVKAMTFVFILAVVGLVLGLLSYALTTIIDYKHQQQAELYLEQVRSKDPVKRNVALANLNEILLSQPTIAKRACLVLSSFVRSGLPNNIDDEHGRLSEDIEQSMHVLSNLLKSDSCLEIDLTGSDLRRLSLPDGNLERVNLLTRT
jgi:hypothetical protein